MSFCSIQRMEHGLPNQSDTGKPYEEPQTYSKMNPCYPPPPQAIPSSHANENYSSYQCNNNQPEYIKDNGNSNCVTVSAPNYNVFHGSGGVVTAAAVARETNRYQYCAQGYTPQQSSSQVTTVTDSYSHRSHPAFSQTAQPVNHQQISHQSVNHPSVSHQSIAHQTITHHSNYSDHDAPLNLQQHHTQMLPRYGTMC
ncbi:hypothetical protein Avbf_02170 [Armadillidium vulgare]|nr:hypothetical protein Avbf_02170 [Armadillidium vulgare]